MIGNFYIVATPIGNLEDISERALKTLREVDIVFCEDTRVTSKLLNHYDIKTPLDSYHQHSNDKKKEKVLELLLQGKNVALVSDAGTPGISDPGNELVSYLLGALSSTDGTSVLASSTSRSAPLLRAGDPPSEHEQTQNNLQIIPIPGASSVTAALSVCGFKAGSFIFAGYFPKRKQKKWIDKYFLLGETVCYLDSRYRVVSNLERLRKKIGEREICVCRELTKVHEEIYRGEIDEVLERLKVDDPRGEVVVCVPAQNRTGI